MFTYRIVQLLRLLGTFSMAYVVHRTPPRDKFSHAINVRRLSSEHKCPPLCIARYSCMHKVHCATALLQQSNVTKKRLSTHAEDSFFGNKYTYAVSSHQIFKIQTSITLLLRPSNMSIFPLLVIIIMSRTYLSLEFYSCTLTIGSI